MNKVILIGRLTKDPELTTTQNDVKRASFTLAVDRKYTDQNGNRQADFLPCVAWRGTAEFVGKYFTKGKKMALTGSVQTRSYDAQDGTKKYVTEINVDEVEFVEPKGQSEQEAPSTAVTVYEPGHAEAEMKPAYDDDELPF